MRSRHSSRVRASRSAIGVFALALLAAACGHTGPRARSAGTGSFRVAGVGAAADPTQRPARLLPESVDTIVSYGSEPGGARRVVVGGLRVASSPDGAILAADQHLPHAPQSTTALPERLGGGFLFVLGTTVWRAERWLGPVKPIFTSPQPVHAIAAGLDRVYVRAQTTMFAIDGKSGQPLDLGPWPASPHVVSYAAADGWRAAAVTDMRGAVATFDAGATWRTLDLPIEPKQVAASGDNLVIGGFDDGRNETWYELRADGSIARLGAAPRDVRTTLTPTPTRAISGSFSAGLVVRTSPVRRPEAATQAPEPPAAAAFVEKEDLAAKIFGDRPLATAIEDGWPLTDGTAIIARDGALARVRLSDGALIEFVRDAFPLESARCHPIPLTRPKAASAFGFVCAEPRGTTVLYAYDPLRGRVAELRRFDKPRVVTSSGNGALAVRGPCAADGEPTPPPRPQRAKLGRVKERASPPDERTSTARGDAKPEPKHAPTGTKQASRTPPEEDANEPEPAATSGGPNEVHPYCVLGHDDTWREIHVREGARGSEAAGGERVVVLADGRIVVLSPPDGVGASARLTVLDKGSAKTAPVAFPRVANDVARALRLGLWLDGFEERRPGVIGGWIEAGGIMLGVEITLDGKATPGQFIRDAGLPFVSGRYGLGWTASRRGYETTDGGMTWTTFELPDPLVPAAKVDRRACGPIGCLAYGWLRVGWGEPKHGEAPPAPPPYRPAAPVATPQVELACEPLAPMPPPARRATPTAPPKESAPGRASPPNRRLGGFGGPPVLGSFDGLTELPPFFAQSAPQLREPDRGIAIDVREHLERYPTLGSLARVYGWGPKTGDWEALGRWQVKWLSPFAGWPDARASLPAFPPPMIVDMTRASGGNYPGYGGYSGRTSERYQLVAGDDPSRALLIGRRAANAETVLYELEADRAPVEVRRADGDAFDAIEGAVRAGGRWFLATALGTSTSATVIWQIEGAVAREFVRIPRALGSSMTATSARTKLARSEDGRAIGLVADGEPTPERATSVRWVLPIDLETGALGEPESLGWVDLAGRTLDACTDEVVGWVLDASMPSSVRLRLPRGNGSLAGVQARLRLTSENACLERLAGTYDGQSLERASQLARPGASTRSTAAIRAGELLVTAMSAQTRFPLRCSLSATPR